MSDERWFDDSNKFEHSIKNIECISTGTSYVESYELRFRSRSLYFSIEKARELFEAYVSLKEKHSQNVAAMEKLINLFNGSDEKGGLKR